MPFSGRKITKGTVGSHQLKDNDIDRSDVSNVFIQTGQVSANFGFSTTGVERISVAISFATPFPSGVTPRVFVSINQTDLVITGITNVSNTGFTLTLSDCAGVDKTSAVTVVVTYLAIAP
jgi:hypothetical protein